MKYLFNLLVLLVFPFSVQADADGPDFYRVSGTVSAQMFDDKSTNSSLVLLVPPGTDGLQNLGCEGAPSFSEWQAMNEHEQQAAKNDIWCKVGINGHQGWIKNRFLQEGAAITEQPSFDCTAPRPHEIEILICGDHQLIALDLKLAQVFELAKAQASKQNDGAESAEDLLKATQRGWIKGRNECWKNQQNKKNCAIKAYHHRIAYLQIKWRLINSSETRRYTCHGDNSEKFSARFFCKTMISGVEVDYREQTDIFLVDDKGRYVGSDGRLFEVNGNTASLHWSPLDSDTHCTFTD